jgi:hypothetical protein
MFRRILLYSCPVLIVHDDAPCGTEGFDNIVLATDGPPRARRASQARARGSSAFREAAK